MSISHQTVSDLIHAEKSFINHFRFVFTLLTSLSLSHFPRAEEPHCASEDSCFV
jgi:hypothetical protein